MKSLQSIKIMDWDTIIYLKNFFFICKYYSANTIFEVLNLKNLSDACRQSPATLRVDIFYENSMVDDFLNDFWLLTWNNKEKLIDQLLIVITY